MLNGILLKGKLSKMMKHINIVYIRFILLTFFYSFISGCTQNTKTTFMFVKNNQGVELLENGEPVLFYQQGIKTDITGYSRNNYIHPLYSLNGDTLTEDFPSDHPHHCGIFWAWHQIYHNSDHISDSWALNNFQIDISEVETEIIDHLAIIKTTAFWKSSLFKNGKPYVKENTTITVLSKSDERIIDFEISLLALNEGISIGGADNEKGYGGFSLRLKLPDDLIFTSDNRVIKPQRTSIKAGISMDFLGTFNKNSESCRVTLVCDSKLPNYPQSWILRQKNSMQNVVFPGRNPIELSTDNALVLHYKLILHKGSGK